MEIRKKKMNHSRRLKVAHVLKSSVYSGAENVAITIIRNLSSEFECTYIASDGPIRDILEKESIPFILLDSFDRRSLSDAVRQCLPDIVHAHDFSATVLCASLKGKFRLISHLHHAPPWVTTWNMRTLVYAACRTRIESMLAVSQKSFDSMVFAKCFQDKMLTVGNPIDAAKIKEMASMTIPDSADRRYDLVFVGRFVEPKNPQRFIRLVAALRDSGWFDIQTCMIGSGDLMHECRELVEALQLQENIEIKGFQKNPYPYIKNAKLLCITSRWEGFGLVAIEANMLGVPVLSTDNAGCSEILGEEAPEICRSDEEFLEKIWLLKHSDEEYSSWKARSVVRGRSFDNIETYMANMACIYRNEVTN